MLAEAVFVKQRLLMSEMFTESCLHSLQRSRRRLCRQASQRLRALRVLGIHGSDAHGDELQHVGHEVLLQFLCILWASLAVVATRLACLRVTFIGSALAEAATHLLIALDAQLQYLAGCQRDLLLLLRAREHLQQQRSALFDSQANGARATEAILTNDDTHKLARTDLRWQPLGHDRVEQSLDVSECQGPDLHEGGGRRRHDVVRCIHDYETAAAELAIFRQILVVVDEGVHAVLKFQLICKLH
mmetsp:Transcript_11228/g.19715  ORF Transcript_11228/g.19715 Transcript_11228/m.19715 type:complete len:244 (+) Transcript_11228:312-1043(+)